MKKIFTTGLIILLPVALTTILVMFFVNILTKPFMGMLQALFDHYHFLKTSVFRNPYVLMFTSKALILLFLFLSTVLIGIVGRWVIIRYMLHVGDSIMHRIPMINKIYKASQDVVHTLLAPNASTFKQVVLVPFPNTQGLSIGLVAQDSVNLDALERSSELVSVFVPGTPNPTMGFMLMYRKELLTYTDLTVEQALKCVVSCGVILSSFSVKQRPSER